MDHFSFLIIFSVIKMKGLCVFYWGEWIIIRFYLFFFDLILSVWRSLHLILNFEIERKEEQKKEKKKVIRLFEVLKWKEKKYGKIRGKHWIREIIWYKLVQSIDKRERFRRDYYGDSGTYSWREW